ncbi:EpsD family peptidyl-prolyl cis-trans isomerase [Aquabacterium sp. UBA2148]|uniref:EpsD family peptidyl-prolyl cis-trans isomerase n=1 Tax=Aquabacterium sp. UBA2148 TaxID=1946042 RepID=UPI00257E7D0F|nr:EpsD family peptidyl-prolyl cis-trans isomerase [Aquabacterium sp. UBA2148]
MQHRLHASAQPRAIRMMALLPVVLAAVLATGCGDKGSSEGKATQAAARVNGSEITVHQINQVLERQQGLRPEQAEAAGRNILEGLIDQQLAVSKAEEQKLDRDPQVMQLLEATRRNILARTYIERAAVAGAGTPGGDEIRKYFDEKPALFSQRKLYALQEFTIPATPEQTKATIELLKKARTPAEYGEVLKVSGLKFTTQQVTQAAEGLPLAIVDQLAKVNDGESLFITAKDGFKAILVMASRAQPVSFEQAKPAIEQFLTAERRRQFAQKEVKAMREAAKIEYLGKFAEKPASGAAAASSADGGVASTPSVAAPPADAAASTSVDADSLSKGLSGLK